ncbi:hypothetical protein MINS_12300 [Mycolicibacterium insubricum]|nr:hypothetical protein [Mycolicibacterium insubricum]MCV7083282.1 hypothetical protein [Mycolicibacterium insubricum]BBZ65801.1 hypothetical protein MINS_12300 [Mycolicibacterium insubricum]
MTTTPSYTRSQLLTICRRASVPESKWHNRDSADAQRQLGEAYALLAAGCDYAIGARSTDRTIWVTIWSRGFDWFEDGPSDGNRDAGRYYLPTPERLRNANGSDWY